MRIPSSAIAAAVLAATGLAACAESKQDLQPSSTEHLLMTLQAAGVQVYQCRLARDNPSQHEWAFVAPEADLYNGSGQRVGRHYAGPTWEALDGSRVVGTVKGRLPAKSPDSIPWLLLSARPETPAGAFTKVTSIQRLDTVGGGVPRETCGAANAGASARVPYSAQYVLYSR
jgi:hypothetical protein